jgi:uncharacterized membrane protein YsdA (DUF1294 family)
MFFIAIYLAAVNVVAFILYGIDKYKARKHYYRIPEKVLLGIAVLGGSIGAFLGMYTFKHKTKHAKFTVGVPTIIIAQAVIAFLLVRGRL